MVTLGKLRDRYLDVHRGSLEPFTINGIVLHFAHLVAALGEAFPIRDLTQETLQAYAARRGVMKWRGKKISPATIEKEMVSLRTAWNCGCGARVVEGRFPSMRNVRMAKPEEKPPFQTWYEIVTRVNLGGLEADQIAEMLDSLYL